MALIRVSTSVAKLAPLPSVGSEVDRFNSVPYDGSAYMWFDCAGDVPSDLTFGLNTCRTSGRVGSA